MSWTSTCHHIVFSTKERRPFLEADIMPRLVEYIGGIVRNLKGQLLAANGPADHIHLAAIVHPTIALADFVGKIKSNSSGWIHETLPDLSLFGWQDEYAGFAVSSSLVPKVIRYINSQQDHHKKTTFQEELIALLDRHGIEYDARYIFR